MGPILNHRSPCRGLASLKPRRGGFTLLEMLVVLAIIGIITLVVITSQSTFNKSLILANAAYDTALAVQSAESYGVGSRLVLGGVTNTGYGLHFETGSTFTLFADTAPACPTTCHKAPPAGCTAPDAKVGDCSYSSGDTLVKTYTLNRNITISKICATSSTGPHYCTSDGTLTSLDIVFVRPDPIPSFSVSGVYKGTIVSACITLVPAEGGAERTVYMNATGEINANAATCS